MDKDLIKNRFLRASKTYNKEAVVQKKIIDKLIEELKKHERKNYDSILEIGCGTGLLTKEIIDNFNFKHLNVNDICPNHLLDGLENSITSYIEGDAENIPLPKNQDLVISCSAIQWFTSIDNFFSKINNTLNKDGIFAFTSFGKTNLKEIKTITSKGLEYKSLEENKELVSKHFEIIYCFEQEIKLYFPSAKEILRHLKLTGVTATSQKPWTKKDLNQFSEEYDKLFKSEKGFELTYNPIYFICKKDER